MPYPTTSEPFDWRTLLGGGAGAGMMRPPAAMPARDAATPMAGTGRTDPFANAFGGYGDWLRGIQQAKNDWWMKPASDILIGAGNSVYPTLAGVGGPASGMAFTNLLDILSRRGKTDPSLMNRDLTSIARGTESEQRGLQGNLASLGLQGSGVGQALGSAIGEAGQERKADYMAKQTAREEQQRRQDLDLFMRMIMDPAERAAALGLGQYNAQEQGGREKRAADQAFYASILSSIGNMIPF